MKKILIISMLLISSPLFSGHHAKGEMSNAEVVNLSCKNVRLLTDKKTVPWGTKGE